MAWRLEGDTAEYKLSGARWLLLHGTRPTLLPAALEAGAAELSRAADGAACSHIRVAGKRISRKQPYTAHLDPCSLPLMQ